MNRRHTKDLLSSWTLGAVAAMLLLGTLHIASLEDERARVTEAIEQGAARALQRSEELKQRGARAICREHHPDSSPRWDDDNTLSCVRVASKGLQ